MIETRPNDALWTGDTLEVRSLAALMGALSPAAPRARVLIVDDDRQNRDLLARILTKEDYEVETAADGESALIAVQLKLPDLILLDVHLPGVNGFDVCSRLKRSEATRLVPVVLVTGLGDREHRLRGIDAGADDFLAKPFDPTELKARVRSLVRLKRHTDTLESVDAILRSLARTIEARDPYTQGHCERLARYAVTMGRRLNMDPDQLTALEQGGYLHDIGKIGVPDSLLLKAGRLTAAEFQVIKQHTVIGDSVCSELRSLHLVRQIVRHHHERQDGSGYPDALQGDSVPLLAQIVGIADVYDALTTDRPYRQALTPAEAFELLEGETGRGLHRRDLVAFFKELGLSGALADARN
jgi:putative two-component system response regulator